MNEAAEFVGWRNSRGGGGGGGGGGSCNGDIIPATLRFTKAFEAFSAAIKEISSSQKKSVLSSATRDTYQSIQQNSFFPTFVLLTNVCVDLPLRFLANSAASHVTNLGSKLLWNSQCYASFFVDPEISNGLYKMIIESDGQYNGNCHVLGLAVKNLISTKAKSNFDDAGGCFICDDRIGCGGSTLVSNKFYQNGKVTLGLELDADKHVAYFFVNDKQVPCCVTNVPAVYFGVTGYYSGLAIELKSFTKLSAPSVSSSLSCTQYGWK